ERKVRLWACACVRRLWARLATDTSRRAVEMVERFADGQATRQAMANAERAAATVRKGDPRVNAAAALLARLGSGVFRFPPADVSEAVVEAGNQPALRDTERKTHADLLRDIFGTAPLRPAALADARGGFPGPGRVRDADVAGRYAG